MKCTVVIPAGGAGKRFGSSIPKQFVELMGAPIIIHTLNIFKDIEDVESIIVAVHSEWYTFVKEMIAKFSPTKIGEVVVGGITRQDSVSNALHSKHAADSDIILIHDAVRPFASPALVQKVIDATEEYGAAIPALLSKETIKEKNGQGTVVKTVDRSRMCLVQTPQGFWQNIIVEAYEKAGKASYEGTDDASLVEFMGFKVKVVDGEENNIKITTPLDLKIAELLKAE